MEATVAFRRREPPKLVTVITVVHLIEMTVATLLMAFVVLPMIFHFSLLSCQFWQIYGRFYVTGLFGTFFYVAVPLPLSVVLGLFIECARVSPIRICSWPASPHRNGLRV